MEYLLALKNWVQFIWTDYRLGTICALISMVIVAITYIRLARDFFKSNNKLRVWPKLLLHAVWRVLLTVCVYFGPVWTIERICDILLSIWNNVLVFFDFVSQADRLTVILLTTCFVLVVFLIVTCIALWQYGVSKYKTWRASKEDKDGP